MGVGEEDQWPRHETDALSGIPAAWMIPLVGSVRLRVDEGRCARRPPAARALRLGRRRAGGRRAAPREPTRLGVDASLGGHEALVVAEQVDLTPPGAQLKALDWIRAARAEVTQIPNALDRRRGHVNQLRPQRGNVGVNVGEDCDPPHATRLKTNRSVPSHSPPQRVTARNRRRRLTVSHNRHKSAHRTHHKCHDSPQNPDQTLAFVNAHD